MVDDSSHPVLISIQQGVQLQARQSQHAVLRVEPRGEPAGVWSLEL